LGLTLQDWQAAFKEMYRVIVPGGWVNLLEAQMDLTKFKWTPGPATVQLFTVVRTLLLAKGMIPDLPQHLPALLEEAGFINIHVEEREFTFYGQEGADVRENIHGVMMGITSP
jgi:ubiquinone/menaquinone biosynthesis C-methylase UbiE